MYRFARNVRGMTRRYYFPWHDDGDEAMNVGVAPLPGAMNRAPTPILYILFMCETASSRSYAP
jgi:hypothetical protein